MKIWQRALLFFLFIVDCGSKVGALKLPLQGISIMKWGGFSFSLDLAFNTGAAWGVFQGHATTLFCIRLFLVLAMILYFTLKKRGTFPIWLLITGALGNIVDYALYGHVIDFFHVAWKNHSFPIFNIADSCITIAFLLMFFSKKEDNAQSLQA